jgi:hypothetical protein
MTDHEMAWCAFPDLAVVASEQEFVKAFDRDRGTRVPDQDSTIARPRQGGRQTPSGRTHCQFGHSGQQ